jgi:hypothetical protein
MMMPTYRFLPILIVLIIICHHLLEYNNDEVVIVNVDAWLPTVSPSSKLQMGRRQMMIQTQHNRRMQQFFLSSTPNSNKNNSEEWSDFDDLGYIIGDSSSNNDQMIENESTNTNQRSQPYIPLKDDIVDTNDVTSDIATIDFAMLLQQKQERQQPNNDNNSNNILYMDYTAIQTRQFVLGNDIALSNYVGTMGFQEVTDWEYYYNEDEDDDETSNSNVLNKKVPSRRQVVQPNPFDSSKYVFTFLFVFYFYHGLEYSLIMFSLSATHEIKFYYFFFIIPFRRPRRTRTSSGSIVRIFRGEFVGTLGGILSSQGLDRRILIKEFSDTDLALSLVRSELQTVGRLQSNLMFPSVKIDEAKEQGIEWIRTASARRTTNDLRKDSANVVSLIKSLATAPYVGILGMSSTS